MPLALLPMDTSRWSRKQRERALRLETLGLVHPARIGICQIEVHLADSLVAGLQSCLEFLLFAFDQILRVRHAPTPVSSRPLISATSRCSFQTSHCMASDLTSRASKIAS